MTTPCTCAICGMQFTARTSYGLCPLCLNATNLREWDRLQTATRNARRSGLPATLTLVQWLSVISDHSGACAWCQCVPYRYIEMVRPLGGLTYENVAPICTSCLAHKRNSFELAQDRVLAYLASARPQHDSEDEQSFINEEEVYA